MSSSYSLSTAEILSAFTDEITTRGGKVSDAFNDGRRLLARSILPSVEDARPGDKMQGGVAVRAVGGEVSVHPYLFRLVCTNGAIVAQTIQTRHITDLEIKTPDVAEYEVREAIAACCEMDVFADTMNRVRSAAEMQADMALNVMPLLSRFTIPGNEQYMADIMNQFFQERDNTLFGLANAVTATAREVRDPVQRWELEEIGGEVITGVLVPRHREQPIATRVIRRQLAGIA